MNSNNISPKSSSNQSVSSDSSQQSNETDSTKSKTAFKRDSLTRFHQFNNLLVYYLGYFYNVYAKKFYKTSKRIVPLLLVSHITDKNDNEIYRYNTETNELKYKLPKKELIVLRDVKNLESDIHRRQLNILIDIANELKSEVRLKISYMRSNLKHSPIYKRNIVMIEVHDAKHNHHIITTENLDDYYEDIRPHLDEQMEYLDRSHRIFKISNELFEFPVHPTCVVKYMDKLQMNKIDKQEDEDEN